MRLNKRWYDLNPTLSIAVSLLQNTAKPHRKEAISFIDKRIKEISPGVANQITSQSGGFWVQRLLQKRRSMDEHSWAVVETMRYLSESDREKLAAEIIRYIYCLENEDTATDIFLGPMQNMEAAI